MAQKSTLAFGGTPGPLRSIIAKAASVAGIGASAAAPHFRIYWRDENNALTPIDAWLGCRVQHDKHVGSVSLTLPWNSDIVTSHIAPITGWGDLTGNALQIYYRDYTTPLIIAPVVRIEPEYGPGQASVTVSGESLFSAIWRRCISQEPGNDRYYNVSAAGAKADVLAQRVMNDGLGLTYANGGMFTTAPVESSTGVLRGDTEQFIPWTVTVATLHSPALSAFAMTMDQSSGQNTRDMLIEIAERGDIAITYDEVSAGAFEFDTTGTYERDDVSATVVISERRGNLLAFRRSLDWSGVSNTWLVKGDGDTSAQAKSWDQDANAPTVGRFENTATIEAVTLSGSLDEIKARQLAMYAEANDAIDIEVREAAGFLFNDTAGLRDTITVRCETLGYADTHTIVGYTLDLPPTGAARVALTLNEHPRRYTSDIAEWAAGPGGRGGGGLFSRRDG